MKKALVVLLVFLAIGIYVWDTHLFIDRYLGKNHLNSKSIMHQNAKDDLPHFSDVHFVEKGRSPFTAFKQIPKPLAKSVTAIKKPANSAPSAPPPVTVSGIMWNLSNPVAIINFADGSSTVAKTGQTLKGGIIIKNIQKNQVEVEYSGKSFILKKP